MKINYSIVTLQGVHTCTRRELRKSPGWFSNIFIHRNLNFVHRHVFSKPWIYSDVDKLNAKQRSFSPFSSSPQWMLCVLLMLWWVVFFFIWFIFWCTIILTTLFLWQDSLNRLYVTNWVNPLIKYMSWAGIAYGLRSGKKCKCKKTPSEWKTPFSPPRMAWYLFIMWEGPVPVAAKQENTSYNTPL